MDIIEFLLELSGGAVLLFGCGYLVGHLLKIDAYIAEWENSKDSQLRNRDTSITK
jgi:hypothetical protein